VTRRAVPAGDSAYETARASGGSRRAVSSYKAAARRWRSTIAVLRWGPVTTLRHFWGAAGIVMRLDDLRGTWWIDNADAAAVVECFLACARERAQTPPEDPERLADEDGDLLFYDAYWEDGELVVSLCRQFALIEDGEDLEYLDRLNGRAG
jgi:hypothetical protein